MDRSTQDDAVTEREAADDAFVQRLKDIDARKLQIENWKSMLDRELAAGLIGGLLLVLIALALLAAMFFHTPVTETVSGAFLLILGFFFGQTAGGKRGE